MTWQVDSLSRSETTRFRKKVMRDENYYLASVRIIEEVEKCVKTDNAVEIFEDFFNNEDVVTDTEEPKAATVAVFRGPDGPGLGTTKEFPRF